jgi:hypothetical protein
MEPLVVPRKSQRKSETGKKGCYPPTAKSQEPRADQESRAKAKSQEPRAKNQELRLWKAKSLAKHAKQAKQTTQAKQAKLKAKPKAK